MNTIKILLLTLASLITTSYKDDPPARSSSSSSSSGSSSSSSRSYSPPPPRRPSSTSYKVSVYDEKMTDIYIKEGDDVTIQASGTVKLGKWVGSRGPNGSGSGVSYAYDDDLSFGGLIYKIGGDSWDDAGDHCNFTASESGYLQLRVNDASFHDNSGSFTVRVIVTR